ncbi:glycerate kinase [Streptococcus pluranimalium]|uniref:glycerate kinase n=1 Tax=Streptococcus pluranimalium TaxID=82348 RepID=UPI002930C388|nr:glycerate kinase [Streptococcus pluranimalium]MDY3041954.1 glycerate kinase [Streptococcus pluranimalium]
MSRNIIVASDSFKGSLSSLEVGRSVCEGIHSLYPEDRVLIVPVADGGEGTVDAILTSREGKRISRVVKGPLGQEVEASYGLIDNGKTAVIEMAEASGITLIDKEALDVMQASTYGTGELIKDAIEKGVSKLYIGLGGSATNDGGIGLAAALGIRFLDETGRFLEPIPANLSKMSSIDTRQKMKIPANLDIILLVDVDNPLCGERGASFVYGPQKGGKSEELVALDQALNRYADLVSELTGRHEKETPGAGAAGGLGFALMTFFKAKAQRGITTILDLIGIVEKIADADLVITGEGHMDSQSVNGKTPIGVAQLAKKYQVPTVAIVGGASTHLEVLYDAGISGVFDIINQPMSLEEAVTDAPTLITNTSKNIISFYHSVIASEKLR